MPVPMTMHREWTVRSTLGHTIHFEPGKVVPVPDIMVDKCMQYGAMPVDESGEVKAPPVVTKKETKTPRTRAERLEAISNCLTEMYENAEDHRDHFTTGGHPRVDFVQQTVGFPVDKATVTEEWRKLVRKDMYPGE